MATVVDSNPSPQSKPVRWYQVPVLWLGLAIITLFFAGAIHLIVVSLGQIQPSADAIETERSFKGIPLTPQAPQGSGND